MIEILQQMFYRMLQNTLNIKLHKLNWRIKKTHMNIKLGLGYFFLFHNAVSGSD
jgi:hypothetical protein